MPFQHIKNIIIDLGFVILNIDYHLTLAAFRKLGVQNMDNLYSKVSQSAFFDQFEKGDISVDRFYKEMRAFLPQEITNDQIKAAWNAMLLDLPIERVELLEKVGSNYRMFLLSNTNDLHYSEFQKIADACCGIGRWNSIFEKTYYSHQIGLRKPNADIFQMVLGKNSLKPEETLFIDDFDKHLAAARNLAIDTRKVDENTAIADIFSADGYLC